MMDLRESLKVLAEEHELQKIKVEVDPKHELGGDLKIHNERRDSPALLFENVKDHTIPMVGQCWRATGGWRWPLGLSQETVFNETVQRASNPIAPKSVSKGAAQDIVFEGVDVDLTKLPLCTNNPRVLRRSTPVAGNGNMYLFWMKTSFLKIPTKYSGP
jgi:4-hydroxy-3-polyprenylbenzoate decarboxylase